MDLLVSSETRQIRVIKADGQVLRFDLAAYTEGLPNSNPPNIKVGEAGFRS
ncbi:hypothetical protein OK016_18590 [Vibrio chagasii]|nr:hypothetical protein [Vibrio chagasii]